MTIRALFAALALCAAALAQAQDPCARSTPGSAVPEPKDLRSENGVLKVDLSIHNVKESDGSTRYCYLLADGSIAPTLRLHPGDLLVLHLKNDLVDVSPTSGPAPAPPTSSSAPTPAPAQPPSAQHQHTHPPSTTTNDPCSSGAMTAVATNLHFHGLTVPPVCHQDDVLATSIQPTDPPFEYRFRIPSDEPPGLYWYHPHIHGFSSKQVTGGASGAMIVEGLERANPEVAGLPERVLVIRDQDLVNPDAPPSKSEPVVPKMLIDRDGDSANNGTGFGKPARDLSVNFVPVPYPDYPPAALKMKPGERQLWRVLNASSITYLNLAVLFGHTPRQLGLVAIDGVPMNTPQGRSPPLTWVNHIGVPPGARVEFIMTGPPKGVPGLFVTRTVDTGQGGENDPNRALASLVAADDAPEPQSKLPASSTPLPAPFDPAAAAPNIVARQGDVEDWVIENRSAELHAFHIHQSHFMLVDWTGVPVNEPFLRDTVNVPYYTDRMLQYPSVRLCMDFRDPNTVGTFVYHCHLLEHEDGGMMGTIRVEPAHAQAMSAKLSKGIVTLDTNKNAVPGPNFKLAHQTAAEDEGGKDSFLLSPPKSNFANNQLPAPLTGGPSGDNAYFPGDNPCGTTPPLSAIDCARQSENGLEGLDAYASLTSGGTGQASHVPDTRISNVTALPAGPFQLTNASTFAYEAYAASPVHRFYQMWQQLDCSVARSTAANPSVAMGTCSRGSK